MLKLKPEERFTSRVENYVKYRPHYPKELLNFVRTELGLKKEDIVVDLGSGTGISSELFLENGNIVFGVEPNGSMRGAGKDYLRRFSTFRSIDGKSSTTTLPDSSADFVVAAQAFHWFDIPKARTECLRILKPSGMALIIWNDRKTTGTPFLKAYEELLNEFGTDYKEINHRNVTQADLQIFFGKKKFKTKHFENKQVLDFEGLRGRLLSSSYVPQQSNPNYEAMLAALTNLFEHYHRGGRVEIQYDTVMHYGTMT